MVAMVIDVALSAMRSDPQIANKIQAKKN